MNCNCWRKHSKEFAKGVSPPNDLKTLKAAWDRDQELIFEMREEIAKLKAKNNQLQLRIKKKAISKGCSCYISIDDYTG